MENNLNREQEIKVSSDQSRLDSYQDLSGVTIKKLNFGLWWVLNIKFIKRTIFWFILVLGVIAWLYTFVMFGYYLTIGINKDEQMIRSMVNVKVYNSNSDMPNGIKSGDVMMFDSADNHFDFLVTISNDNPNFYADFDYAFVINGTTTPPQAGFIMPNEQKKIIALGVESPDGVASGHLSLSNISWHRINRHEIQNWEEYKNQHLAFNINEPQFNAAEASGLSEKINVSEISFTFGNNSPYNYYHLPLNIFLYSDDRVVGTYQTSLENIGSGEVRKVRVNYSGAVDNVNRIEVVPDLNIMRPDIYFKLNGGI